MRLAVISWDQHSAGVIYHGGPTRTAAAPGKASRGCQRAGVRGVANSLDQVRPANRRRRDGCLAQSRADLFSASSSATVSSPTQFPGLAGKCGQVRLNRFALVKFFVEIAGFIGNRMDKHCTDTDGFCRPDSPQHGVTQEVGSESFPLPGAIDGEPAEPKKLATRRRRRIRTTMPSSPRNSIGVFGAAR